MKCNQIPLSTGQSEGESACECEPLAIWDYQTLSCVSNCPNMPYTTGEVNPDGSCVCAADYMWSPDYNACVNNCQSDPLSTGFSVGSICECLPTAFWDEASEMCATIDCSLDMYSTGTPTGDTSFCDCQPNFMWNDVDKICEVDCSMTGSLSDKQRISVDHCGCLAGSYWNPFAYDCYRNCSLYDYATGPNLNAEECICEEGYYWDTTTDPNIPRCQLECGLRKGELNTYNEENAFCDCNETAYFFSYQLELCAVNCFELPNTIQSYEPSADTCSCVLGYTWDPF